MATSNDIMKFISQYGRKALPAIEESAPGLVKRGAAIEGEVVGDLVKTGTKRSLPDIEAEIINQKLLTQSPMSPIMPYVDDVINQADNIIPPPPTSSGFGTALKIGGGLGAGALGLSMLGDESSDSEIPYTQEPKKTVTPDSKAPTQPSKAKIETKVSRATSSEPAVSEVQKAFGVDNDFDKKLEKAREVDNNNSLLFALLKAGQTGASAVSGAKADTSYADAMLGKGNEAVNRLKTDEEMKQEKKKFLDQDMLRNPNSSASIQARDIARRVGLKVSDQTTAKELADAGLPIGTLLTQKLSIDARKEDSALKREMMALAKEEKAEAKKDEGAGKHIDTYTKMLYKDYQGVQQAETNAKRANDIVAQNMAGVTPGAGDIAILYNFIKGLDKNSAVREGEIALSKQARSVLGRLDSEVKRIQGGDLLDKATREAFAELIDSSAKAEKMNFIKQKRNAIAAGAEKGYDPETLDRAIFADIPSKINNVETTTIKEGQKKTMGLPSQQKPGSIINQKSTGKRFRVNADGATATEI